MADSITKVSTWNIGELVSSLNTMLRTEIDVLMLLFEETQPDFYKAYKNARIIVDYSGGGPSKDTETGSDKPNG